MSKKRNQTVKSEPKTKPVQKNIQVTESTSFSGPIPPPESLAHYGQVDPTMPNRILALAEREAENRHNVERKALDANITFNHKKFNERRLGQIFGLTIGLSGLICSTVLAFLSAETASAIVGGSTVIGLVGLFVTGQYLGKNE